MTATASRTDRRQIAKGMAFLAPWLVGFLLFTAIPVAIALALAIVPTVVMTRTNNDSVGPCVTTRAAIINNAAANVAVDIHATDRAHVAGLSGQLCNTQIRFV